MITTCPHCAYKDMIRNSICEGAALWEEGGYGRFYQLPVEMSRNPGGRAYGVRHRTVYGCPCCGKLFIEP